MSLLDNDAQPNAAPQDDGLEAYAPSSKPSRAAKASASAGAPGQPAAKEETGGGLNLSGLRVSLMPSELEGKAPPDIGRGLLILAFVLVIETVIIGAAYFFTARAVDARVARQAALQVQIDELDKAVVAQEAAAKEAASYNGQVNAAKEALDNHLYWTKFFALLESKTRPTVKYLNFSGDADTGTVTLDAVGRTYRDVAEQIVALREDKAIADVRTTSAAAQITDTGEITGVAFTMVIRFKIEAWTRGADEAISVTAAAKDCGTATATDVSPSVNLGTGESESSAASASGADEATACFEERLRTCQLATLKSGIPDFAMYQYDIIGSGKGGCLVRQQFVDNVNPEYVGKTMTCPFDQAKGLTENLDAAMKSKLVDCSGPLSVIMKEALAAQDEQSVE